MKVVIVCLVLLCSGCASTPVTNETSPEPITMSSAVYPVIAAALGIEGYVRLRFDLTKTGKPVNIQVIKAEPAETFDKAAIQTVAKWRYAPTMEDGIPVYKSGLVVQLDFSVPDNKQD